MTTPRTIGDRLRRPTVILTLVVMIGAVANADQNGTCEMDDGRKARYYCPDGFEVMLAGGGKEDCSGRCYKKGSADELSKAIKDVLSSDFKVPISDVKARAIAEEMIKPGGRKTLKIEGKAVTLKDTLNE